MNVVHWKDVFARDVNVLPLFELRQFKVTIASVVALDQVIDLRFDVFRIYGAEALHECFDLLQTCLYLFVDQRERTTCESMQAKL